MGNPLYIIILDSNNLLVDLRVYSPLEFGVKSKPYLEVLTLNNPIILYNCKSSFAPIDSNFHIHENPLLDNLSFNTQHFAIYKEYKWGNLSWKWILPHLVSFQKRILMPEPGISLNITLLSIFRLEMEFISLEILHYTSFMDFPAIYEADLLCKSWMLSIPVFIKLGGLGV